MLQRNIILTGASGFLGQAISAMATDEAIITLARNDASILCDLNKEVPRLPEACAVIHAAGLAHIIARSAGDEQMFYDVNVTGTKNLLKALENNVLPRYFIYISSVAVYGLERGLNIREDQPLAGKDPYAKSKIEAEYIVQEWCSLNNITYFILRLPLIIGSDPKGNLRSMINGIRSGIYVNIAGGTAKKSMVLAGDIAGFVYKLLDLGKDKSGIYNLTDGYHPSFYELSHHIGQMLSKKTIINIPLGIARILAKVGDLIGTKAPVNSRKLNKIVHELTFDDSKARTMLGWKPTPVLEGFKVL